MTPFVAAMFLQGGSGSPGGTWSATIKGSDIVLGGGGLIAQRTGGGGTWQSVLGTGAITGTSTFMVTGAATTNFTPVGFGNASINTASYPGANTNSISVNGAGDIYYNGSPTGTNVGFTFASGDTVKIEVNTGSVTFRVAKNAGAFSAAISYAGVAGTIYPAAGIFDDLSTATGAF